MVPCRCSSLAYRWVNASSTISASLLFRYLWVLVTALQDHSCFLLLSDKAIISRRWETAFFFFFFHKGLRKWMLWKCKSSWNVFSPVLTDSKVMERKVEQGRLISSPAALNKEAGREEWERVTSFYQEIMVWGGCGFGAPTGQAIRWELELLLLKTYLSRGFQLCPGPAIFRFEPWAEALAPAVWDVLYVVLQELSTSTPQALVWWGVPQRLCPSRAPSVVFGLLLGVSPCSLCPSRAPREVFGLLTTSYRWISAFGRETLFSFYESWPDILKEECLWLWKKYLSLLVFSFSLVWSYVSYITLRERRAGGGYFNKLPSCCQFIPSFHPLIYIPSEVKIPRLQ